MFELGVAINISEYLSRRNMKFLPIVATIVALSITTSAYGQLVPSNSFKTKASSIPKVQVIENQTKLRIYNGNKINNIPVNSLKVRVLDSNTCENKQVKRQTLSGKKLLTQAIKFNQRTGNLVVGVLLQDCLRKNLSAVFILEPKPNWNNYVVHRVAVPGKRQINNRFSTYPLGKIKAIGFRDLQVINCPTVSQNFRAKPRRVVVSLDRATPTVGQFIFWIFLIDGNLLIKHTDSTKSEALLVYTSSNKPVGKYAGCVITQKNGRNICPSFK